MPKLIDHGRRRHELITAAWDLIAADGAYAASVRHVAERAGVAAGSVRFIFPSQDDLVMAVVGEVLERVKADSERRAVDYSRADQAVARLAASLPLFDDQQLLWRVERALRFAVNQLPELADDLEACRSVRAAECREVVSTLGAGLDVTEQTLEFEQRRTLALMEGLGEQLCSPDGGLASHQARAVITAHMRGVEANWNLAYAAKRRELERDAAAKERAQNIH